LFSVTKPGDMVFLGPCSRLKATITCLLRELLGSVCGAHPACYIYVQMCCPYGAYAGSFSKVDSHFLTVG